MSNHTPSRPIHVLLVEDNPGDVRLIREGFESVTFDTTFHTVSNGDAALEFLQEKVGGESGPDLDLVLLDLNLPRTSGFDVLETIRDDPDLAPLPVLVLTSSNAQEDVVRSYDLSANAYLTKPNDPEAFADIGRAVEAFWLERATLPPVPS